MTKIEMKSKGAALRSSEKKHRRLFSAAVVLLVCCLAFVGAVGAAEFSGGSGTKDEPYQIKTIGDFNNITFGSGKNTHYKLMNDLDFGYDAPNEFGTDDKIFYGVFDGNGKTISNISFSTNTPGEISLFGRALSSAKISNLSVANVSVTVGEDVYHLRCGTITNLIQGNGTNCTVRNVTVTINPGNTVTDNGIGPVGGIFGNIIESGGQVSNCSIEDFTVIVNKPGNGVTLTMEGVGGICAQVNQATVTGCSVDNFVVRSPDIEIEYLGGIFGRVNNADGSYGIVYDCHVGNVDASQVKDVYVLNNPIYMPSDYNPIYGVYYKQLDKNGNKITGTINIAGVTGWALTADTQWYNEDEDSFEISTAEELAGLAKLVNLGNTFSGKTVVLIKDIDLENKEWTPIGKSLEKSFQGTFEGGGRTISYLKVTRTNENVGLFGYVADAEIRNLTVTDADISGSQNVGGIAGNAGAGTSFVNCTCSETTELRTDDAQRIGGIAGVWNNTDTASPVTLQNCIFNGTLSSTSADTKFPNAGLIGNYTEDSGDGKLKFVNIKLDYPESKTGYIFKGWKGEETEPVYSPVTLNITRDDPLTEVWKKNNYTITFKDGDTQITILDILEFEYESSVTAPANPTKDGYIFKGWSPELPEKMPAKNITVKALWEKIPEPAAGESQLIIQSKTAWQVVFYPNGGEGNMNAEVFVEGEEEALPKNSFYRDGYVFKGWSLTPEGEVFYIDEETVVIDKTTYLYAVWEEIPDTPQTPEKPNIPTIPIIIAGIIVGLLVMILVITRKRQKEE